VPLDLFLDDELQQVAHEPVPDGGVAQRQRAVDLVAVLPALPAPSHVSRLLEIGEHAIRRALGDLDRVCDLYDASVGVGGDSQQHLCMVGDERPRPQRGQVGLNTSSFQVAADLLFRLTPSSRCRAIGLLSSLDTGERRRAMEVGGRSSCRCRQCADGDDQREADQPSSCASTPSHGSTPFMPQDPRGRAARGHHGGTVGCRAGPTSAGPPPQKLDGTRRAPSRTKRLSAGIFSAGRGRSR
jgi:hypothetical protein